MILSNLESFAILIASRIAIISGIELLDVSLHLKVVFNFDDSENMTEQVATVLLFLPTRLPSVPIRIVGFFFSSAVLLSLMIFGFVKALSLIFSFIDFSSVNVKLSDADLST